MLDVLTSTAGQIAAPVLGYFGNRETNRMNQDIAREATNANQASAREAMAFERQEARNQEKFQERMSSSAMQRMVKDYKKAGINPLLGLPGGGSSTPSGSAASGSSAQAATATMTNPFEGVGSSAVEAAKLSLAATKQKEEIGLLRAQKNNTNMDTFVKSKGVPEADTKNEVYNYLKPRIQKTLESFGSNAPKSIAPKVFFPDGRTHQFKKP